MRVAAIDCGTNSIRLLIADMAGGVMHEQVRDMQVVRLGQGVDATGRFADDAIARTLAVCDRYAEQCRSLTVERLRFVATSATRDASNRDLFIDGVQARLGVTPEVISGDEEAALSFAGATRELHGIAPAPYLVVDIGGGSTEFVLGTNAPEHKRSVNIGCVRMTERHGLGATPSDVSTTLVRTAIADIDAAIATARSAVPFDRAATVVAVAGSATTVAAHALHLSHYDRDAIHGTVLSLEQVRAASDDFLALDPAARAVLPYMHPGRVDVIAAGALVLRRVMEVGGFAQVRISEHDILDGIAWSIGS